MATYQQMGHHTQNLLFEPRLSRYTGAIISPVNASPEDAGKYINKIREELPDFDVLLDTQLYNPQSNRGQLSSWPYYPSEVDTADTTNLKWWDNVTNSVVQCASEQDVNGVCSPAILPKQYSVDYYSLLVQLGAKLADSLERNNVPSVRPLQTAIVKLNDLSSDAQALTIASVLTQSPIKEFYLVFEEDLPPRQETTDGDLIRGAMVLIGALQQAGINVLVAFCGSNMILWKSAGASSCATGKYFNLRRFTLNRFEDPSEGGRQLPYWFEEGLITFLRESDVMRLNQVEYLSDFSLSNPFGKEILTILEKKQQEPSLDLELEPWLGLGWRQFLYWFTETEHRIESGLDVHDLLLHAERLWLTLDDEQILMDEARNDGSWIRPWRRALIEYRKAFASSY
ncbi:MAG: hypothetical protein N0C84_07815 [Candidatus Thiodiazotropha taylori]|uniref:Uncharacterized protein n=1 Tax=Candidatus Thiodiazotropha taylori TaxID=2792791 RepID=A0A9E4N3A2_9GAMM|nr:hypothetical protein [Candidatus Thiodiazotropha taylori]MCW4256358.1 hypothetical protein [Candidatus Thiodiazotropha taylori]